MIRIWSTQNQRLKWLGMIFFSVSALVNLEGPYLMLRKMANPILILAKLGNMLLFIVKSKLWICCIGRAFSKQVFVNFYIGNTKSKASLNYWNFRFVEIIIFFLMLSTGNKILSKNSNYHWLLVNFSLTTHIFFGIVTSHLLESSSQPA